MIAVGKMRDPSLGRVIDHCMELQNRIKYRISYKPEDEINTHLFSFLRINCFKNTEEGTGHGK